jgi:Methyltransferase FkbM domain
MNLFTYDVHSSLYNIQGSAYEPHGQQTIELIRGDDFIKKSEITEVNFLKIDIEGAEYDALLGFEQTIKDGKIKAIQFEYGYINITTKKLLVDYYDFFEKQGYVLGKIFPKIVEFRKYEFKYEDFLGPNYIAVKKSEVELISALKRA